MLNRMLIELFIKSGMCFGITAIF